MKRTPLNKQGPQTKKWLAFRRQFLKKHVNWYDCWNCWHCQKVTQYPEVDHIDKRSTNPESKYDEDNLQILCTPCHRKETARKP